MPDKPTRIACVVGTFNFGGTEMYLLRLLRSLDRTRYEPYVVVMDEQGVLGDEVRSMAEVYPVHLTGKLFNRNGRNEMRRLAKWMKETDIRLVHTLQDKATIWGAVTGRAIAGLPVVASHRASTYYVTGFVETGVYLAVMHTCVAHGVPNSAAAGASLKRFGIPWDRMTVVHNGIPTERLPSREEASVHRDADGASAPVNVAILGRLVPVKNQKLAVEAVAAANERGCSVTLTVIGSGPEEEPLRRRAEELGVAERITWAGYSDAPTPLLLTADVCILTSDSEGFPNTVVEYMAAGRPVISTDVGGTREIVTEGETGYLVPPGDVAVLADAIVRLARDPELRKRMGGAARALVERSFTVEQEAARTMAVYDRVLAPA